MGAGIERLFSTIGERLGRRTHPVSTQLPTPALPTVQPTLRNTSVGDCATERLILDPSFYLKNPAVPLLRTQQRICPVQYEDEILNQIRLGDLKDIARAMGIDDQMAPPPPGKPTASNNGHIDNKLAHEILFGDLRPIHETYINTPGVDEDIPGFLRYATNNLRQRLLTIFELRIAQDAPDAQASAVPTAPTEASTPEPEQPELTVPQETTSIKEDSNGRGEISLPEPQERIAPAAKKEPSGDTRVKSGSIADYFANAAQRLREDTGLA